MELYFGNSLPFLDSHQILLTRYLVSPSNQINLPEQLPEILLTIVARLSIETVKTTLLIIAKLLFGDGCVRYNHVVLLVTFLDIIVSECSDLLGGDLSVHYWHVDIHENKAVGIVPAGHPALTHDDGLLATDCIVRCEFVHLLQLHCKALNIENSVVNDQNVWLFLLRIWSTWSTTYRNLISWNLILVVETSLLEIVILSIGIQLLGRLR